MSMWLRQSTAPQEVLLGPFLDSTDGNTQETGLTIINTDIKLWKEGATTETSKNALGAVHIASGRYYIALDATDTNTLGKLEINVHVAGALPVRREFMVLPAVVYDALVLGTDNLDVSTVQLAGQAVTAGAGVTFPSSVASPTNITGGTITTVTTTTNLTNLPAIPANWLTATGIAASALNGKGDWLNTAGVAAAVWNAAVASYGTAGTYGALIELNLDAAVSSASAPSAATVADAVWDEALSGHAIAGSAGAGLSAAGSAGDPWATLLPGSYGAGTAGKLIGDNINATISSRLATTGYTAAPTAAVVADAVWDELLSGHAIAGSAGAALTGAGSAGDPWSTALPGSYGAGTAGKLLSDNLNATVSSRASQTSVDTLTGYVDTEVAAIKTKTDFLPSATAGAAGGLFIAGSNAATTVNFTGTISTVTNLTNLPSIPANWLTATGIAAGALNGKGDWPNAAGVAAAVWNAATSAYGAAGSYGLLIETNIDAQISGISGGTGTADWTANQVAAISSILGVPASGTTPADPTVGILDTIRDAVVAVKAKTDNLPADPADASDITASFATVNTKLDTIDNYVDTEIADIQARLPAALVGGRMDANLGAINASTTARDSFHRAVKGNVIGTVGSGSTTTSIVSSSLTPSGSVADKFKGRLLTFSDDTTTANLRGQSTDITANTSSAAPTFTVTALTTAPVSSDIFSIT